MIIRKNPSEGSLKVFVEIFKDICEEVYSSIALQNFGRQLEMILKLLMNSFTSIFLKFC